MDSSEENREKILAAALARFVHYGFHKTTMAEIAKDCSMSAANLYRFFQNKAEIIVTLAMTHFEGTRLKMQEIADDTSVTSREKLERFFILLFECNRDILEQTPKISEVVEFFQHERPDIVKEMVARETNMIERILEEGNSSGEFTMDNVVETAKDIRMALTPFIVTPFLLHISESRVIDHGDLETRLRSLLGLLLKGITIKQK